MHAFSNIIGQEPLVRRLQNTNAGHAYIFDGAEGMGKFALACAFAKALQCEKHDKIDKNDKKPFLQACDKCISCRVFESGNHPDIFFVEASKTKSIGVDDAREQIILPMGEKPFRYKYKIFIVNKAETLTPAAQNALLKTIEEPAPFGVFLFLATHTRSFLPTVLSRCVTLKFKPVADSLVAESLRQANVPEAVIVPCTLFAKGNPGRALAMAQSEDFAAMRALAQEVADRVQGMERVSVFKMYNRFEPWRESIQPLLDMLYLCYREKLGKSGALLLKPYLSGLDTITQTKRVLHRNGNFQLAIELMLIKLSAPGETYKGA